MAGLKYNQETTLPETMSHGSGWHGPLDDYILLQTGGELHFHVTCSSEGRQNGRKCVPGKAGKDSFKTTSTEL